jgi:dihydrofolate reductase
MAESAHKHTPSPRISLIAAMARNRVIGRAGAIPWKVPGEQLFFKRTTLGHTVIMGRKTFESIGRPLPGRTNVVISRRTDLRPEGCFTAQSLPEALRLCPVGEAEAFIIGGAQLYTVALPIADRIYLTVVPVAVAGDVFFPEIPAAEFAVTLSEHVAGPQPYDILIYDRVCEHPRPPER